MLTLHCYPNIYLSWLLLSRNWHKDTISSLDIYKLKMAQWEECRYPWNKTACHLDTIWLNSNIEADMPSHLTITVGSLQALILHNNSDEDDEEGVRTVAIYWSRITRKEIITSSQTNIILSLAVKATEMVITAVRSVRDVHRSLAPWPL